MEEDVISEAQNTKQKVSYFLYDWIQSLATAVCCVVLVFTFVAKVSSVKGTSMLQTLQDGDKVVVLNDLIAGKYCPGDIVVLTKKSFYDEAIIKRIIAVEGQTVDIDFTNGIVYVDGKALEEPYINTPTNRSEGTQFPLTVEEGKVFVLGDNRNGSSDSRNYLLGQVDKNYILGKAVFLMLPGVSDGKTRADYSRIGLIH